MKNIVTPPFLKKGDLISLIAPAKYVKEDFVQNAILHLESIGLKIHIGKHIFNRTNIFSGTDQERTLDFQNALDNSDIKAVFCLRGGYGSVRIIDQLDFTLFQKNPKWIIGFSDITIFHNHIHTHCKTSTIHSNMPLNFPTFPKQNIALSKLFDVLFGNYSAYNIKYNKFNIDGICKGQLIGGNLSILYSLLGTNTDIDTRGKILFLEEINEYAYHIDRMFNSLIKANKISNLSGLIIGGFTKIKKEKEFGFSAYEIIKKNILNFSFPVCFNFPTGHIYKNYPLILGKKIKFNVNKNNTEIKYLD